MTRKILQRSCFLFLLILIVPVWAHAQSFGVRLGIYTDPSDLFVGGEFLTPITRGLYFNPNIEYVFIEHGDELTFNFDVHYDLPNRHRTYVWVGAGVGIIYINPEGPADAQTDVGLNLLFGVGVPAGNLIPYVQAKVLIADNSDFILAFGLRF